MAVSDPHLHRKFRSVARRQIGRRPMLLLRLKSWAANPALENNQKSVAGQLSRTQTLSISLNSLPLSTFGLTWRQQSTDETWSRNREAADSERIIWDMTELQTRLDGPKTDNWKAADKSRPIFSSLSQPLHKTTVTFIFSLTCKKSRNVIIRKYFVQIFIGHSVDLFKTGKLLWITTKCTGFHVMSVFFMPRTGLYRDCIVNVDDLRPSPGFFMHHWPVFPAYSDRVTVRIHSFSLNAPRLKISGEPKNAEEDNVLPSVVSPVYDV